MFEKIKDFLYDISDIFVSLLIIGMIFFAVSWKISDTLSVDVNAPISTTEAVATTEGSLIVVTPIETTDAVESTDEEPEPSTEPTTEQATQPTTQTANLENFTVNEGELGFTIGTNLEAKGFVSNKNEFVKRLIEMGYDSKLRAGTFKLSKSDDLDTIIRILSGQKR
ncbi:MAG TPA: hypothetical protein DCS67_02450 [Clostridiales bacterium UBA8960]|jgi:hypothetical protein|nr:hypothetical protein [Clostridiales bacterium UBA8960]